ncbi:MAG: sigma-54-dependent Fis family transcriptional regulator [Blastopirellula sp.]|nr:MAG: sigma-54-dependent Fis family transcriptional regulator [Blastopirellula sp.]
MKNTTATTLEARNILVVDDNRLARESISDALTILGNRATACGSGSEALQLVDKNSFDVILTDLQMPGMSGIELVQQLREQQCDSQILMITAHATIATAVEAMRYGAMDYLQKPISADQLENAVNRALEKSQQGDHPTAVPPNSKKTLQVTMIGTSLPMQNLRQRIAQVASTDETVLITGESGTGKELVARALHLQSRRADQALISLNCPVLSAHLMESELFGHEKGAFTSADQTRVGRFQLAERGTILLDEITEIELPLQAKLLRVLQERCYERVGSSQTMDTDVRVLATSNRDLQNAVEEGKFRQDLYYRLAVVPLELPPLRDRREDVPLLVDHFLNVAAERLEKPACELSDSAISLLQEYHWPGNIRELENIMTRASVLAIDPVIGPDQLAAWLVQGSQPTEAKPGNSVVNQISVGVKLDEMEQRLIQSTLEQYEGHREKTAVALGISVRTLSNKLRNYGLAPRAKTFSRAI